MNRSGRSRRISSGATGSRWHAAQQRRRPRHLTLRGRRTLATLGGVASLALLWVVAGPDSPFGSPAGGPDPTPAGSPVSSPAGSASASTSDGRETPSVEAAPRPIRLAPRAPAEVFERLPVTRETLDLPLSEPDEERAVVADKGAAGHFYEIVRLGTPDLTIADPLRVEYTMDAELTRHVFRALRLGRVALGHVILMDPATGRILAYASTDTEQFPPTRIYPAASLVKVITAAAALEEAPSTARLPCRFRGSPYRLTPSRIDPPSNGREVSLRNALATSNNQCFAQLAVHAVGSKPLMEAIRRFGWLAEPGPAHAAGTADPGEDRYDVGRLGCGLAGSRITPMHAAQLAGVLARGELVAPRWIERVVDAGGRELPLPATAATRQVLGPELAEELRTMLVDTTKRGTARSAFRKRNGHPLLGPVTVAGKTGSLSGKNPSGRYEWFIGAAPAERPRIAVAVLVVNGELWWRNASQIAAEVLRGVFCERSGCTAEAASRWTSSPETTANLQRDSRRAAASNHPRGPRPPRSGRSRPTAETERLADS